jgi:hypothetical protein
VRLVKPDCPSLLPLQVRELGRRDRGLVKAAAEITVSAVGGGRPRGSGGERRILLRRVRELGQRS